MVYHWMLTTAILCYFVKNTDWIITPAQSRRWHSQLGWVELHSDIVFLFTVSAIIRWLHIYVCVYCHQVSTWRSCLTLNRSACAWRRRRNWNKPESSARWLTCDQFDPLTTRQLSTRSRRRTTWWRSRTGGLSSESGPRSVPALLKVCDVHRFGLLLAWNNWSIIDFFDMLTMN